MDVGKLSGIVVIMLLPTLIVGAGLYLPRALRAVRRTVTSRGPAAVPGPVHPPIEQLAVDLRRLLHQYGALKASTGLTMRAHRLVALEAAIADGATEAAAALGLPCPDRGPAATMSTPELCQLLRALANAGLVLPPTSPLLGAEGHG